MVLASEGMWFLTRSSGMVALVLLTGSVALGVVTSVGWSSIQFPRFVTIGLHRNLSLVSICFLGLHVATTVLDGYAPIGWLDVVFPSLSPYRTLWLGLGTLAVDVLIVVVVTSLLRRHLSYRSWKAVHWASWGAWLVAVLHALGTGSDTMNGWAQLIYISCAAVVIAGCWWRIAVGWPAHLQPRVAALVASVLVPLIVVIWALSGPLQRGWAQRAGTPAAPSEQVSP
jgi:methionine sulfoxide reductase heme-binding subunit